MKKLIIVLLLISQHTFGVTYYVRNGGNDSSNGTSDGTAWSSLSKAASSVSPGDIVLFKRGSIWTTPFSPGVSGTSSNRITYGAYGTGNNPIITSRGALPNWTNQANWTYMNSDRWSIPYGGNFRTRLWVDGTERQRAASSGDVTSGRYYLPDGGPLWVYSTQNPALAFSTIEASGVQWATMYLSGKDYITFQNIDFRGGGGASWVNIVVSSSNYIIFDGCSIGRDTGCYGLKAANSNYGEIKNCTFDTGDEILDYWNAENSEDGVHLANNSSYWKVHHNTFVNWGHTAIALVAEGTSNVSYNEIYNNDVSAADIDYGRPLEVRGQPGYMTTNKVYNNNFYDCPTCSQLSAPYLELYNNIFSGTFANAYRTWNIGYGLLLQDYDGEGRNMKIYNNVFANNIHGGIIFMDYTSVNIVNNMIINNIFINNGASNSNRQIEYDASSNINNNIFRNNSFYSSAATSIIRYRGSNYTVAAFNALTGTNSDVMANNIVGNASLTSTFHLQTGNPAIGAGYTTLTAYDADGVAWNNPPSIGAFEFGTIPDPPDPPDPATSGMVKVGVLFVKHNGQLIIIE